MRLDDSSYVRLTNNFTNDFTETVLILWKMSSNLTSKPAGDYCNKYVDLYYHIAKTSLGNLNRYVTILIDISLFFQICIGISTAIIIVSNSTQIHSK